MPHDEFHNPPTRDVTIAEMLAAMAHLSDDVVFRFFQPSRIDDRGVPITHGDTLRLTVGQVRRELAASAKPAKHAEACSYHNGAWHCVAACERSP